MTGAPLTAPAHLKRRGGPLWQLQQARAARAEWVAARRREGHTLREIADALGISAPRAWKISKAADQPQIEREAEA